jgi:hypothetical protein
VDNHRSSLSKIKNTRGIRKESSYCPKATGGLKQRPVSCPQGRLRTGGPIQEIPLLPDTLQLESTTPSTTPVYNSSLQLRSTEQTTDYHGRSAYHVYYYFYYRRLPRTSPPTEPRTPRSIVVHLSPFFSML